MAANPEPRPAPTGGEIYLKRVLKAPRDLVFKAWITPEHLVRWFGPDGFSVTSVEVDARAGGAWRIGIRSSDGMDCNMHGVYREVVRPERLVFTHIWEEGHPSAHHETLVTIKLSESEGQTTLIFHKAVLKDAVERQAQTTGWSQCLNRLDAYITEIKAKP
ncbi:MAG: SRPBCC domain-containing protein [Parvibaculum sp.]|uniref:SRPBCC family protein n=1 Tax=Parvibaculum sp. TaxID=2024848 RepID=UPI0025E2CDC0|nr:SRPBCC domain-containing protein [Parvibaculum sp.]MCE9650035.1 SRPBCC domain-containing protein [Parvibaculum sp.]